jgi:hypothetical protein
MILSLRTISQSEWADSGILKLCDLYIGFRKHRARVLRETVSNEIVLGGIQARPQ